MKRKSASVMVAMALFLAVSFSVQAQTMSELGSKAESNSMKALEKGKKELDAGKLDLANKYFHKAQKLMKQNFQAYAYQGIVAFKKRDVKTALAKFKESLEKFKEYKAYIVERKTDYARTLEKQLNTARVNLDSHNAQYAGINGSELENQYNSQKNLLAALKKDMAKAKEMKYPAFFHFKYGNILFATRQEKAAKAQYLAAVDTDPSFKDAYANLAVCWFIEGDCAHAVEAYKKAKELKAKVNPNFERDLKKKCGVN